MSLSNDLMELLFESSPERSENDSSSSSSTSGDLRRSTHDDKIKSAFSKLTVNIFFDGILQFWKPITIDGRRLLSTVGQPFTHSETGGAVLKYRLRSEEYVYNIDVNVNNKQQLDINEEVKSPGMIINGAPAATAFLDRFPLFVHIDKGTPLSSYALECGLKYSFMLPVVVCWPSQNSSSSCIGVVECSVASPCIYIFLIQQLVVRNLQEVGLSIFQVQQHIPYQIISGLKPAKAEIEDVLKIVCKSNHNALALVWIPFEDHNHVSFSSYLKGTREKQILSLKLTGYVADLEFGSYFEDYYGFCDMFALEMGEDFVDKTLEDYKSRFCNDVSMLRGDMLVSEFFDNEELRRLAICLNSIHTGAFCYAFEFIWWHNRDSDDIKFVEALLLKLKELLPSFKLASGAQLGDELNCINVGDSTATETKFFKIFQGNRLSPIPEVLEEGRSLPVPTAKYNTTPIPLSREVIEQQFGNTETEAAENLKGLKAKDTLANCQVPDVENSTRSEKILQENILLPVPEALERGKKPMVENYIAPSARKYKTAPVLLSREAIEHKYGMTMKEAAKALNVSISTLKRKCKDFGISEWQGPNPVKRKVNDSSYQSHTNEKYDGAVQDPSAINKNENSLTIKAEYADDMIKFHLGISEATFITVEEEIGKKFKLTHGTYKLKYLDEDKDWILLASDQDMSDCMKSLRNLGRIVVRLRVLPSTQPISC